MSNGRTNSKINIEANKETADNAETVEKVHMEATCILVKCYDSIMRIENGIKETIPVT